MSTMAGTDILSLGERHHVVIAKSISDEAITKTTMDKWLDNGNKACRGGET